MSTSAMISGIDRAHYADPVDEARVRADWAREGFTFGVFRDPAGQEWNGFVHDTDEYVVVARGRMAVSVGAEAFEAAPGDRIRIPAGVVHSLKTLSETGSVWFYGYGRAAGGGDG